MGVKLRIRKAPVPGEIVQADVREVSLVDLPAINVQWLAIQKAAAQLRKITLRKDQNMDWLEQLKALGVDTATLEKSLGSNQGGDQDQSVEDVLIKAAAAVGQLNEIAASMSDVEQVELGKGQFVYKSSLLQLVKDFTEQIKKVLNGNKGGDAKMGDGKNGKGKEKMGKGAEPQTPEPDDLQKGLGELKELFSQVLEKMGDPAPAAPEGSEGQEGGDPTPPATEPTAKGADPTLVKEVQDLEQKIAQEEALQKSEEAKAEAEAENQRLRKRAAELQTRYETLVKMRDGGNSVPSEGDGGPSEEELAKRESQSLWSGTAVSGIK